MNTCSLVGRLVREPDLKYTQGAEPMAVTRFTVAVDRKIKKDGEESADFISCIAFGKTAEFVAKYFAKGQRIGLTGRIQTGSYTNKDGQKVYTTDVIAENVEFVESKAAADQARAQAAPAPAQTPAQAAKPAAADNMSTNGFMKIPDHLEDEGLPFF